MQVRPVSIHGKPFTVAVEPVDFWGWVDADKWETGTFEVFNRYLTPETNYVDIGAWIGPTVLYAAGMVKRVWAVEPDPVAWGILQGNLALNPKVTNVECFEQAIMDREGTVKMGASLLGCSVTRLGCTQNQIEVPCATLRAFVEKHAIPDPMFVKMDVEGAESLVLKDLSFFEERKPTLYVSTHAGWWKESGANVEEATETVWKVGRLYKHQIASGAQLLFTDVLA